MPGLGMRMRSVEMDFHFGKEFAGSAARCLRAAAAGRHDWGCLALRRADEIELSWGIIDPSRRVGPPVQSSPEGWRADFAPPLEFYEQGWWGGRPVPNVCWQLLAGIGA